MLLRAYCVRAVRMLRVCCAHAACLLCNVLYRCSRSATGDVCAMGGCASAKAVLELHGVFAVLKPAGETSARTVARVKAGIMSGLSNREQKWVGRKFKVGHGGTLDPLASGVLVIGLGSGCKALGGFLAGGKGYRATARFGRSFDTLDCTGLPTGEAALPADLTRDTFAALLAERFTGDIMQRPPAFSAVRVNGERAYDVARRQQEAPAGAGVTLEIAERSVRVESVRVAAWDLPEFQLEVVCGGGTYIRSLIDDAARAAGTLAAMYGLERTQQGVFDLAACVPVADCADAELLARALRPCTDGGP